MEIGKEIRIVYGGEVNDKKAEQLIKMRDIDGFLLGHSVSMTKEFSQIVETVDNYYNRGEQDLMIH